MISIVFGDLLGGVMKKLIKVLMAGICLSISFGVCVYANELELLRRYYKEKVEADIEQKEAVVSERQLKNYYTKSGGIISTSGGVSVGKELYEQKNRLKRAMVDFLKLSQMATKAEYEAAYRNVAQQLEEFSITLQTTSAGTLIKPSVAETEKTELQEKIAALEASAEEDALKEAIPAIPSEPMAPPAAEKPEAGVATELTAEALFGTPPPPPSAPEAEVATEETEEEVAEEKTEETEVEESEAGESEKEIEEAEVEKEESPEEEESEETKEQEEAAE